MITAAMNGAAMPLNETATALTARPRKCSARKPRPTSSMYNPTPSCAPT